MLMINTDEHVATLSYTRVIEALRIGHESGVDAVDRLLISEQGGAAAANHLLCWPAWQYREFLGAKLVSVFPSNVPPVPSISTVYVLFDGHNGEALVCITGAEFTLRKTAADSALGASFLARQDARVLLMLGAGRQAPHQIEALCTVRPSIDRVMIWNRSVEKARRLAEMTGPGIKATAVTDLEAAARQSDVICCATGSATPLLHGAWLAPGTHVDLVGGFTRDMREADDEAIRRASVFVDSRWFTVGHCGDIVGPIASGAMTEQDIRADLFDLCAGRRPGRVGHDEITLFKNGGGGHLDLMMARLVYDLARRV